jgi:hypothetical protein
MDEPQKVMNVPMTRARPIEEIAAERGVATNDILLEVATGLRRVAAESSGEHAAGPGHRRSGRHATVLPPRRPRSGQ